MASKPAPKARLARIFGAVNVGSFRISAMIMGETETGELVVLGSGHRASQGIKRGYVTDMKAATYAIRDAVERAERTQARAFRASGSPAQVPGSKATFPRSRSKSAGAVSRKKMSSTC